MHGKIAFAGLVLTLSATCVSAQDKGQTTTRDDIYCSGVVTTESVPRETYLITGEDSSVKNAFVDGDYVYFNKGANQGVKVGDYFRVVRSYGATLRDPVDSLSFKAAISEDTQKKQPSFDPGLWERGNGPVIHVRDLPRRAVGEIVVIGTTPTTATGMIVFAMESVHVGDDVELDQ